MWPTINGLTIILELLSSRQFNMHTNRENHTLVRLYVCSGDGHSKAQHIQNLQQSEAAPESGPQKPLRRELCQPKIINKECIVLRAHVEKTKKSVREARV